MKNTLFTFIITILSIIGPMVPASSAEAASATSCPWTANEAEGVYVVNFPRKTLFSNSGTENLFVDARASIPAGTYEIRLRAYDNHSAHGGQNQGSEIYKVIATMADGKRFTSGASADIPENANVSSKLVNRAAVINSEIVRLRAQHAAPGLGNWQSVIPICAEFRKVGGTTTPPATTTPPTTPINPVASCTVSKTNPVVGEVITYTASSTGGKLPYTYQWTGPFTSSAQSLVHTFTVPGVYNATVIVRDADNKITTAQCPAVTVTNINIPPVNPPTSALDGSCSISATSAQINQDLVFTASGFGGTAPYTYQWSGSDGLISSAQTFTGRFSIPGFKNANVIIRDNNGNAVSRTCSVTVGQVASIPPTYNPPVYYPPTYQPQTPVYQPPVTGTPVSGVFLNQVPATGIEFGFKMTLFTIAMLIWSVFAAYLFVTKRYKTLFADVSLVGNDSVNASNGLSKANATLSDKINSFKLNNQILKGMR
jgi:hypothetical protein